MPSRSDVVLTQLEELQQDLLDLWHGLTRDPVREARKERAWTILAGVFAAVGAIVARKAAAKVYGILTGEAPPIAKQAPAPAGGGGPSSRRGEREAQPEPEQTASPV